MIGGLLSNSASRLALVAAAGLFMGGVAVPSAKAADLGGDCCADLEERVAELEATTARKGNRRMSLTITGHINRSVMYWNDGRDSKTVYGVDNTQSSTRFSILGEARVQPRLKVGFELMLEADFGGRTGDVNQFDEDGKAGAQIGGSNTAANSGKLASFNANNTDPIFGGIRRAAWWIESQDLGRLTVGRYDVTGPVATIDLGGVAVASGATMSTISGGLFFRSNSGIGGFAPIRITDVTEGGSNGSTSSRNELIRYDSPAIAGFVASAHVAEAGDYWGAMLRYAGEFSGFRLAAGIGYESIRDRATDTIFDPSITFTGPDPDIRSWGGSVAVLHVPSGLFVQGHYQAVNFGSAPLVASGYYNEVTGGKSGASVDATDWRVQGGIAKNWFGYGNTVLYGEYARSRGFGASELGRNFGQPTNGNGFSTLNGVTDTEVRQWGIGIVQNLDAAATELYVGYRNYSLDVTATSATVLGAGGNIGKGATFDDIGVVMAGARVKF